MDQAPERHADADSHPSGMRREIALISVIYTLAWGLLLSASGRYWDDWAALDLAREAASAWSRQQGLFWQLDFLGFLSALPGTERIGHVIVFALYLLSAIMLHRLVARVPGSDPKMRVLVPTLFAVFPVNGARFALVDIMYAISLAAFMVAWWLLTDFERPGMARRAAAGLLFLFALLSTPSLMFFIALVPLYVLWVRRDELRSPEGRREIVARYGFVLLLPVVAWVVKSSFLQPSGLYADYNQLGLESMVRGIAMLPEAFRASFIEPIAAALSHGLGLTVVLAVVTYLGLRFVIGGTDRRAEGGWRRPVTLWAFGAVAFVAGVYPYVAVGKLPQLATFESRHQLLVPLGAALLVFATLEIFGRVLRLEHPVVLLAASFLIASFVLADVGISLAWQRDWYKQVSLMEQMASSGEMGRGTHFIFSDEALELNAASRGYAAYEYNGMMRKVFGDARRFGVAESSVDVFDPHFLRQHQQYNCWEYEPTDMRHGVTIVRGPLDITSARAVLGLMWREVLAPAEFRERVADVVRIDVERTSDAE